MSCQKPRLADLLGDYLTGHLSESDAAAIRAHVAECESCRDRMTLMERLYVGPSEPSIEVETPHIPLDVLDQFDRDPDSLDETTRHSVQAHLSDCDECVSALEFVSGFERELSSASDSDQTQSTYMPLPHVITALAIAAVLVVMIATFGQRMMTSSEPTVWALRDMIRSATEPPMIWRESGQADVIVSVPLYHNRSEFSYGAVVMDTSWSKTMAESHEIAFPMDNRIYVTLPVRSLSDGLYTLHLLEISRDTPPDTTSSAYPFRLSTSDSQ